jgi:hypothetical protein
MWTLWIFGPAVEDRLGSGRFFVFFRRLRLRSGDARLVR